METEPAFETSCFFKKLDHGQSPPPNCSHALFSLLDFLTFEDGANMLPHNVSNELPLCAA
jgi:hypothetical protein